MRPSDIKSVLEISRQNKLENWSPRDLLLEIQRQDSISLISQIESQTIGFCLARLIMNYNSPNDILPFGNAMPHLLPLEGHARCGNECEIYNLGVEEKFRRRGIGGGLLQSLFQTAKKYRTETIWLEVRQSNGIAIEFYRKNGFRELYQRKNFYSHPPENALIMRKILAAAGAD